MKQGSDGMKTIEVVCAIMQKGDNFLIAKRNSDVHANKWEFPGGKVEHGEIRESAIVREIKEELELDIEVIKFLTMIEDKRPDCCLHVYAYICKIIGGKMKLHAHHEVRYVKATELFTYDFEDADIHILKLLQ